MLSPVRRSLCYTRGGPAHSHTEDGSLKVEYVEETSVRKSLIFEIEPEVVEKEIETRARDYARKVKLPGFRPGKVPPEVVKRRFREAVLGDAAESIVNRVVFDELEGRGLRPLASPKVEDLKIDENQPMTFRAVFETLPLVEVPEYRGLEVKAKRAEVKDEDVDSELNKMRDEAARYDAVEDRPAREGDHVVLDVVRHDGREPLAERAPDSLRRERGGFRGGDVAPPCSKTTQSASRLQKPCEPVGDHFPAWARRYARDPPPGLPQIEAGGQLDLR